MNRIFWPLCAAVFIAALALSVVVLSMMNVLPGDRRAFSPKSAHTDLSEAFGSEEAKVVVVAIIPVGQECVAPTIQALRQLSGMYPDHLFVGLADMEAPSAGLGLTFRGYSLLDTPAILRELGETADVQSTGTEETELKGEEPPVEPDRDAVLKGIVAELERDPPKSPREVDTGSAAADMDTFCATISINGQSRFSLSSGPNGGPRDVYFSGPHGTLYNGGDIRAAVEATIVRVYGELPEPRMAWEPVKDVLEGKTPVPLQPR